MRVIIFCIHAPCRRCVNIMLKRNTNSNQNYNSEIPLVIKNKSGYEFIEGLFPFLVHFSKVRVLQYSNEELLPRPILSVQTPVINSLSKMWSFYILRIVEVGNGSRNFQNPVISASRKVQFFHRCFQ